MIFEFSSNFDVFLQTKPLILWIFGYFPTKNGQNIDFLFFKLLCSNFSKNIATLKRCRTVHCAVCIIVHITLIAMICLDQRQFLMEIIIIKSCICRSKFIVLGSCNLPLSCNSKQCQFSSREMTLFVLYLVVIYVFQDQFVQAH